MEFDAECLSASVGAGPDILGRLAAIAGEKHVIAGASGMEGFLREPRGRFHGKALCVVEPSSTQEVADILKCCNEFGVPVVPQGGNTGLVGGQVPVGNGQEIILSLRRLQALREIDLDTSTMTVEAGMILAQAKEEAGRAGRLFPLTLGSEGSCTIGGNIATNAGGTNVIAYGSARDLVLGLEVVLADGRILSDLSKLRKNNTGFDLTHLFAGSEGTLGVITAAVLKLFPKPNAVELLPRVGLDLVHTHFGAREVLPAKYPWYVLLELSSQHAARLAERLRALLETASEKHLIEDAAIASSLEQRNDFWKLRELLPEAQTREGASIKHDISVPIAAIPAFLEQVFRAVTAAIPGARLVAFGHVGDGNIHCNVSQPAGADPNEFLARWDELNAIVHGLVIAHCGSISAEHGIGQLKRDLLPKVKDKTAMEVMRAIKKTLDPKGILNPGKLL
jgi:FAD/FMN-containing dehydrogenase